MKNEPTYRITKVYDIYDMPVFWDGKATPEDYLLVASKVALTQEDKRKFRDADFVVKKSKLKEDDSIG